MNEHSPTSTREETLRKKHHEILMQVAYALKDLENQPEKRVYITQKLKHLRKMFCELIPPHEIRKRGNRTLTEAKISVMQEARKINAEKRKRYRERFQLFVVLGLAALLLEMVVPRYPRQREDSYAQVHA